MCDCCFDNPADCHDPVVDDPPLPDWERELLEREAAPKESDALVNLELAAGEAIHDRDAAQREVIRLTAEIDSWRGCASRLEMERDAARAQVAELARERDQQRDLLHSVWLYVSWRYVTRQLTTEQKELWADAVETSSLTTHPDEPSTVDRWWRPQSCTCGHPRAGHVMLGERIGCETAGCHCRWYLAAESAGSARPAAQEAEEPLASGPRTLTVSWHPEAIRRAVDGALAVLKGNPEAEAFIVGDHQHVLSAMDLACLIDAGRAFMRQDGHACHDACPCEGNPSYRRHMQHHGVAADCPWCPDPADVVAAAQAAAQEPGEPPAPRAWRDRLGQQWSDDGSRRLVLTHDEYGNELFGEDRASISRAKVEHQNGPLTEVVGVANEDGPDAVLLPDDWRSQVAHAVGTDLEHRTVLSTRLFELIDSWRVANKDGDTHG